MAEIIWLQILHIIAEIISYFTRSLELLIVIFLTTKLFKCDTHFKDAYYVILNIGYIFDLIKFFNSIIHDSDTYLMRMVIHGWYSTWFLTLWNVILCCNRCTVLAFPNAHKKIWSALPMTFIICFLIAFPFIVDGYILYTFQCTNANPEPCLAFRRVYYLKGTIFNSSATALMIIFIIFSMYKSKKNAYERHESKEGKTERKLIYQALFSSFFQLIYFNLNYVSAVTSNKNLTLLFVYSSEIVYHLQHIAVMILHFIFSAEFRNEFYKFYFLDYVFKVIRKKTKPSRISSTSSTVQMF